VDRIAAQLASPDVTALIATQGPAIVALAQMRAKAGEGEVQRFYVDAAWHGQGIAQPLMAALIASAEAAGLAALHLGVWSRNDRAIAFYRRQGFHPDGNAEFLLDGVPQSDLLMRRPLAKRAGSTP
jgi:diamine N-acetyltransferase